MKRCWLAGAIAAFLVAAMCGAAAYASMGTYSMSYLAGTSDQVENLHPEDTGLVGGQQYTVTSDVPQRQGYEFICWTLDYGIAEKVPLKVTYQVNGDSVYGLPEDSTVPTDDNAYYAGDLVHVAPILTSTQNYAMLNGVKLYGTWSFSWDSSDFNIYQDTVITGTWKFAVDTADVTVRYMDMETNVLLAPDKIIPNQPVGSTVRDWASDIIGYVLLGNPEGSVQVTYNPEDNLILFLYFYMPV